MTRPIASLAAVTVMVCLGAPASLADSLPKEAQQIDPYVIIKLFQGKVSEWNQGGLAYWGNGGEYQGLSRKGDWYGIGKWYVTTKGTLCHESTWYPLDKSEKPSVEKPYCWKHVVDSTGQIWEESSDEPGDWYRFTGKKEVNGNKHSAKLKKIRASLGL